MRVGWSDPLSLSIKCWICSTWSWSRLSFSTLIIPCNKHIRGLFINYWDSVNKREHLRDTKLDFTWLETSTSFFSTCKLSIIWLHLANHRGHKKSITWRYTEHSDVANVTSAGYNGINAIVPDSLHLNLHTIQSNALHMTLNPHIIYICSVDFLCVDATEILFRSPDE